MDSNLSVICKNNTKILNNAPQLDNQATGSILKSRAAKIGLGILAASIPLAGAAFYYHKYSVIQDDLSWKPEDAQSQQETSKSTRFDTEISKGFSSRQVFEELCLAKDESGCVSFTQNQFAQIIKNDYSDALDFLKLCLGKQTKSCQSVITQTFTKLTERNLNMATVYAKTCTAYRDKACLDAVDATYRALLIKDKSKALDFADHCFKTEHQPCMSAAEKSLPEFLEGEELQALNCAMNDAAECQVDVPAFFDKLLNTSSLLASLFAKVCINKKEPIYQSLIEKAFPEITKKNFLHAVDFANTCLDDEACGQAVQKHLPLVFQNFFKLGALGQDKRIPCLGKEIPVCKDFIKNAYFQSKNHPFSFVISELFSACIGKNDPDCQAVTLDIIENEDSIPYTGLKKCLDQEDKVCQQVILKAFDNYKKNYLTLRLYEIATACIQKKNAACEHIVKNSFEILDPIHHSFAEECLKQKDARFVSEAFKDMLKNNEYYVNEYTQMCGKSENEACQAVMKVMPKQVEYESFKEKFFTFVSSFNRLIDDIKDLPNKRFFNH